MLTSRISALIPEQPEPEDVFSSALESLFTDDVNNSHGTPGSRIIYESPRFGNLTLHVPVHPDVEEGRKLFAHYLWNAGVIAADLIETASTPGVTIQDQQPSQPTWEADGQSQNGSRVGWNRQYWDVRGKRTLELGAGTALPSLVSALSGAKQSTITDHPSSPALTTDTISRNVNDNVFDTKTSNTGLQNSQPKTDTKVEVYGYTWGTTTMYDVETYGRTAKTQQDVFDRIIIADCLWMPSQHVNLVRTILHYLDPNQPDSCALVVAGFHTGRAIVRSFFETATGETSTDKQAETDENESMENEVDSAIIGQLRLAEIFEIDVESKTRPWKPHRDGESREQAKRWCVCAVLARR